MNRKKAVSPLSNVVDHLGVPARRGDCIAPALQMLLLDWHQVLAAWGIVADNPVLDADDLFRVSSNFHQIRKARLKIPSNSSHLFRRNELEILIYARFLGGFGSGIIFILVPIYMKELMGAKYNGNIVDLLITQFGLGIFSQYFIGESKTLPAAIM